METLTLRSAVIPGMSLGTCPSLDSFTIDCPAMQQVLPCLSTHTCLLRHDTDDGVGGGGAWRKGRGGIEKGGASGRGGEEAPPRDAGFGCWSCTGEDEGVHDSSTSL